MTEEIAARWFDTFNRKDLDGLLGLYAEDAQHYSPKLKARHPETGGLVTGKSALRAWWQDAFERLPDLHYAVTSVTANHDRVFVEYVRTVPTEPDMRVAEVYDVRDGLIVASRVYHG